MATNKHAQIRYRALDNCFRNPGRRYHIDNLVDACNEALDRFTGGNEGVKKRQVQEDIRAMEEIWGIDLLRIREGRRVYFTYADPSYSIYGQTLNELEIAQLKNTVAMLHQFKSMPQLEWIEELLARLEHAFNLRELPCNLVEFEHNPYLHGLHFFSDIFNAIVYKQVLNITYRRYGREPKPRILHPYYLKQYNNRWFLFGRSTGHNANGTNSKNYGIVTLALDRIERIETTNCPYIDNTDTPFDEYFRDVVGVTVPNQSVETITLEVDRKVFPYIETKPLHGSQKIVHRGENTVTVQLNLIVNHELENLLMGYADSIRIVNPPHLRMQIAQRLHNALSKNG